jgi:hypothetical protein
MGYLTALVGANCGLVASLRLDGNPFITPPQEVLQQGTAAILEYLRNQSS